MQITCQQFLVKMFPFRLFKKKIPKNTHWEFDTQRQNRCDIIEFLVIISMIPVFYFTAVVLLSL